LTVEHAGDIRRAIPVALLHLSVALRRPPIGSKLGISRSTFYEWRTKGVAPKCIKLPNGEIRIRRDELERWLDSLEEAA
jgi:predicted DNA-binding transcriptional regulator AlpA